MQNDINKEVGFEYGMLFFTLMLDGWEKAEADGGCREFGSSSVNRVGRPLERFYTLWSCLGTSSCNPIQLGAPWGRRVPIGMVGRSTGGSLVIGNWSTFVGTWQSSWCGNLRKNKPAQRNSGFYGLLNCCYNFWNALLKIHEWAFKFLLQTHVCISL